ncbi:hypothetical protein BC826DRAFT_489099 [Russula brevipes]|nr:hypothetical protein BC826DRAFT_489099 [Russula brevipes]
MSRESIDIVEQAEHEQFALTSLVPSDNALDEDKQGEQIFRLMGYHLLYIAVALLMITWKLVSSFHKLLVISPKAEAFLWPLLGFILSIFTEFICGRPEICPRFLKVDFTPHILGVLRRSSDDAGSELPLPTRSSVVRNNGLEEGNQSRRPPFGVELTGYRYSTSS